MSIILVSFLNGPAQSGKITGDAMKVVAVSGPEQSMLLIP